MRAFILFSLCVVLLSVFLLESAEAGAKQKQKRETGKEKDPGSETTKSGKGKKGEETKEIKESKGKPKASGKRKAETKKEKATIEEEELVQKETVAEAKKAMPSKKQDKTKAAVEQMQQGKKAKNQQKQKKAEKSPAVEEALVAEEEEEIIEEPVILKHSIKKRAKTAIDPAVEELQEIAKALKRPIKFKKGTALEEELDTVVYAPEELLFSEPTVVLAAPQLDYYELKLDPVPEGQSPIPKRVVVKKLPKDIELVVDFNGSEVLIKPRRRSLSIGADLLQVDKNLGSSKSEQAQLGKRASLANKQAKVVIAEEPAFVSSTHSSSAESQLNYPLGNNDQVHSLKEEQGLF